MSTDQGARDTPAPANELTPEEAQAKRKYHLALARQRARAADLQESTTGDTGEATTATFILPGD